MLLDRNKLVPHRNRLGTRCLSIDSWLRGHHGHIYAARFSDGLPVVGYNAMALPSAMGRGMQPPSREPQLTPAS